MKLELLRTNLKSERGRWAKVRVMSGSRGDIHAKCGHPVLHTSKPTALPPRSLQTKMHPNKNGGHRGRCRRKQG